MARVTVDKNYFQFTQGKITEASPLSFPENSMKDELNIDINFDGTIQRRKGIDYEPGYTLFGTSFQKVSSSTNPGGPLAQIYKWENVGGYPKETPILVVRYGTHLVFYESLEEPLSSAVVGSMMEVGASESIISDSFLGFAEAKGYLFVVGQGFDPFYIKYNPTTNNFEKTSVTIKIRDLDGLPEDIEDHIRPSTLTGIHRYNLLNQGWPFRRVINKNVVGGTRPVNYEDSPLAFLRDPVRGYPSNSDLYRSYTESGDEKGDMIEAWIRSVPISTSRAPRGKVIIEAFRENRKELAQEYSAKTTPVTPWVPTNYEERSTTSRPTCVTFFQGHVMFSGVNDLDYNDKIYVSQSLVDVSRAGRAYSVNDPTSGIESSPLDTDGGVIRIEGVDRILSLQAIGGHLLVIGNNGLWSIRGAEGGFSVNDIVLNKLSSVGGISASSVVNYEGTVLFWSDSGIYAVSLDSQFDTLSVANITEETIQRDYVAIPEGKKKYANPIVDTLNRKIYWLYNNDATDPINCRMNRVLILDMRTSSFFDYEFPVDENDEYPFVVAGFSKPRIGIFESTELVTVGGVTVTVNSEDVTVTSSVNISTGIGNAIKYLTFKGEDNNWRVLFSELYNTKFVDWASDIDGGVDYVSFVETGYELMDDSMRDMQATYIFTYFNRTEQGFVEVDEPGPGPGPDPGSHKRFKITTNSIGGFSIQEGGTDTISPLPSSYLEGAVIEEEDLSLEDVVSILSAESDRVSGIYPDGQTLVHHEGGDEVTYKYVGDLLTSTIFFGVGAEYPLVYLGSTSRGPEGLREILNEIPSEIGTCGVIPFGVEDLNYSSYQNGVRSWTEDTYLLSDLYSVQRTDISSAPFEMGMRISAMRRDDSLDRITWVGTVPDEALEGADYEGPFEATMEELHNYCTNWAEQIRTISGISDGMLVGIEDTVYEEESRYGEVFPGYAVSTNPSEAIVRGSFDFSSIEDAIQSGHTGVIAVSPCSVLIDPSLSLGGKKLANLGVTTSEGSKGFHFPIALFIVRGL